MLKVLITCVLLFTCSVFQRVLFAQTMIPDLKADSALQIHLKEIGRDLIEMNIRTISKSRDAIVKAKAWRPDGVRPHISLNRENKNILSNYTLSGHPYDGSDLRYPSLSDPAKALQKLTIGNQRVFNSEMRSIISKKDLMNIFSSRKPEDAYLKYLSNRQGELEEVSNRIRKGENIESRVENVQRDFAEVKDLPQKAERTGAQISPLKRVYSEKALKKIYDSIGSSKVDSLVHIASRLSRQKMTDDELLEAINNSFPKYHNPLKDTTHLSSMKEGGVTSLLQQVRQPDLTKVVLLDSITQSLPKVNADRIKSKYMKSIDSIRLARMKYEGFTVSENPISENIKASIIKQKQKLRDRLYFDGVMGVLQDGKGTILKISPSLGYNITNFLSFGLGPSVLLTKEDREWNGKVGVRSFLKGELWHQCLYIQLEDNVDPVEVSNESISPTMHSILAGGGCLLPISKTLAINPSIFHRINNSETQFENTSPWVFRIGISSITKPIR